MAGPSNQLKEAEIHSSILEDNFNSDSEYSEAGLDLVLPLLEKTLQIVMKVIRELITLEKEMQIENGDIKLIAQKL